MGWFSDRWDDAKDWASDTWENVKEGDIGGIFEDTFKGMLGVATLGYSNKNWMPSPDMSGAYAAARDRKVTIRNTVAPHEIVYGRVRKGGTVVYVESSGDHDEYLHLIIILASHKCHSVERVYFNDKAVAYGGTKTGSSQVITPYFTFGGVSYAPLVARFVDGSQTVMDSFVLADAPDSLTTAHALTGHAFLYLKLSYDQNFYQNGIPDVSVEMQGHALIFEPVGETYGYSNNHALCTLDYLLADYGLGIPIEEIDIDSFDAGATYCDETVDTPPQMVAVEPPGYVMLGPDESYTYELTLDDTEPRFSADGVLRVAGRPLANLETLAQAGAAYVCFSQGKWRYIRAEYVAPTLTLDESDLISGIDFAPSSGKGSRFNIVKGQFINPLEQWELTDYPAIVVQDYIDNDLEELEQVIDQPLITSPYRAQRLGKIAMERSRYGLTVSVTAKLKALELNVGDRVNLSITALGWTPKVFMVMDMDINLAGGVRLSLREDHSSIYDWDYNEQITVTPPPAVNLPDPRPVAPSGMAVLEQIYAIPPLGNFKTRALITWTTEDSRQTWHDAQFKLSADSEWTWIRSNFRSEDASMEDAEAGVYDFRVRSINGIGQYSEWVQISNFTILGINGLTNEQLEVIAQLYAITGLSLQNEMGDIFTGRDAAFEWSHDNAALIYFNYYEIEIYSGAQLLRTEKSGSPWYNYAYEKNALDYQRINGVPGIYWTLEIRVKPVSLIRNNSNDWYAGPAVSFEVTAPVVAAPDVTLSYSGANVVLTWPNYGNQFLTITTTLEHGGNVIQETTGNSFTVPVDWTGSRTFNVRAAHLPTRSSTVVEVVVNPVPPGVPVVTSQVIANNILFTYASTQGSLPIDRYEIRRGGTYNGGLTPDTKAGTSSFTVYTETVAATIVFWFEAVDTAGNHGGYVSASVVVSSPPNYQLLATYSAKANNWPGTKTNALVTETNSLLVPVNTTETFQQHFDNNFWSTPQDQVTAGFEYYIQPSTNTAQYVVTYDYGSSIDSAILSATTAPVVFDGAVTAQVTLAWSPNNSTWTSATAGQTQALATSFRYARVTIDITAVGGDDLAYIEDVLIKLDKQVDEDFGPLTATSSDTNGTFVAFNKYFIDANTPTVTINAGSISGSTDSTPIRAEAIIRFVDAPDPIGFYIYVYNAATGARVTATGSWHVYGFTRT